MQPLNQGWDDLKTKGITKLENFLTRGDDINFSKKEYMQLYTTVYNLSTMQVETYTAELYKRYTESIQKYLSEQVVPLLTNCEGSLLLKELEVRWRNHQIMVRWLKNFF